ncbi:glycoside hydrolase family 5 protein [Butyrivibrio sp. VCD2006]|uniref:glycoside hydrolase family 5 protein n=1 Tax=Butyrivibrio sp. VCD2006 TaxID=1280664 RepID=UPI0003F5EBDF|nr:glycoside hydrolase family 5 protein [Butyrivibrio sp. VCD2006]
MKRKVMALLLAFTMAATAGCGGAGANTAQTAESAEDIVKGAEETTEETAEEAETEAENTEEAAEDTAEAASEENTEESEEEAETAKDSEESDAAEDTKDSDTAEDSAENTEESEDGDVATTPAWEIVNDMTIGWNLGNTLDAHDVNIKMSDPPSKQETCWGNPETTQEMIDAVLDLGFNTIRVPITWKAHIDEEGNIDPAWMDRVQEVVDYVYGRGAYCIINVHHEDWNYPYYDNQEKASQLLSAIWTQVSERFKDYDSHLIFELQNEPRKVGTDVEWNGGDKEGKEVVNAVNMAGYEAIRAAGGNNEKRLIMFPGYAASSQTNCIRAIELPENDDCVAVSVHAYTPYEFALESPGRSTYDNDHGDLDRLLQDIERIVFFKNVPVIIGEFGAVNKDNEAERVAWVTDYLRKARAKNIPCVWWDNGQFDGNGENFGIIDRRTLEIPYPDLVKAIQEFK